MVKTARGLRFDHPALASLEIESIARGVVVLDQMAKRAETEIIAARTFSPGRYWILFAGSEAEVEEAMDAALQTVDHQPLDQLLLHHPHQGLRDGLANQLEFSLDESLVVVETSTVSSALHGVERCLKEVEVRLIELRLGAGLGGKGVFTLTGSLDMVQACSDILESVLDAEKLLNVEVIAQPHPDLPMHLLGAEPSRVRGPK